MNEKKAKKIRKNFRHLTIREETVYTQHPMRGYLEVGRCRRGIIRMAKKIYQKGATVRS